MLEIIWNYSRHHKVVVSLLALIAALVVGFGVVLGKSSKVVQEEPVLPTWSQTSQTSPDTRQSSQKTETLSQTITVDVKGAVQKPGVYDLASGSRVTDAVQKAGGLTDKADQRSINLAQKLADEAVIYVATEDEASPLLGSSLVESSHQSPSETTKGKVNLNTATITDLQSISGIGAKRAQDIIDYRDSSGGFKSVDELSNVSGIGDKTLEKLREEVTVD